MSQISGNKFLNKHGKSRNSQKFRKFFQLNDNLKKYLSNLLRKKKCVAYIRK